MGALVASAVAGQGADGALDDFFDTGHLYAHGSPLVSTFAFFAAFNERFFQDILRVAGHGISQDTTDTADTAASKTKGR